MVLTSNYANEKTEKFEFYVPAFDPIKIQTL